LTRCEKETRTTLRRDLASSDETDGSANERRPVDRRTDGFVERWILLVDGCLSFDRETVGIAIDIHILFCRTVGSAIHACYRTSE
jgi:hypothetical protein